MQAMRKLLTLETRPVQIETIHEGNLSLGRVDQLQGQASVDEKNGSNIYPVLM